MTTAQLCRAFGLTLRQLEWLVERRIVRPTVTRRPGQGGRYYDTERGLLVGIVAALRQKGLTCNVIRKLLPSIEPWLSHLPEFLVATEREIVLTDSKEKVLEIGCLQHTGFYVVDIGAIRRRVQRLEQRERAA